jgi:hypothetical protein
MSTQAVPPPCVVVLSSNYSVGRTVDRLGPCGMPLACGTCRSHTRRLPPTVAKLRRKHRRENRNEGVLMSKSVRHGTRYS